MYRYVVIGVSDSKATLPDVCPVRPCEPALPGLGPDGKWTEGYKSVQGNWQPIAIAAVEFASYELATFWLNHTSDGVSFKRAYGDIIVTCTDPGRG